MKQFASNITTSKLRLRQQILGNVVPCVAKPEFPEQGMKGILKLLLLTLGKYQDRKSRYAVEQVIETLATSHPEKFPTIFLTVLAEFGEAQKKTTSPSKHSSGSALWILGWSSLVVRCAFKNAESMTGKTFRELVQLQSLLLYGALSLNRDILSNAAYNKIKRVWKEVPGSVDKYVAAMNDLEQTIYLMCMENTIMLYLWRNKDHDAINKHKGAFIERYVKTVIGSRTVPSRHLLIGCKSLLRHVSHEEFQGTILPAIDKAMLRSPEIILEGFIHLLAGLNIDLSQYALETGKHLATQLHSKEDNVRDVAAEGCVYLAKQLSDPSAVEKVVTHLFQVLNGSEGKLTITGQRLGLLTGIGNLSQNTVAGMNSVQTLATSVVEQFIPVLQQEVHEGTLVHALSVMSLWCAKLNTDVSNKVTQWFKTGMGLKSSTSLVRHAYIQCMGVAYHGDRLVQGLEVLPLLLQVIEKAQSQTSNTQLVAEALAAATLLMKLSLADIQAENKLAPLWSVLQDTDKQIFTNEKFLSSATDEALMNLSNLLEKLILDHPQKMTQKSSGLFYQAFIYVLTHGTYQQRKHAHNSVKKVLSALGGAKVAMQLLKEFRTFLRTQKVTNETTASMENGESESNQVLSSRLLTETLFSLTTVPNIDPTEAEAISLEVLFDAHHPCIMCFNNSAWTDIVAKFGIDAKQIITSHVEEIMRDIKNREVIDESVSNAIHTMVRISGGPCLELLMEYVLSTLKDPALCTVTLTEYEIMNHPEGNLYDKSVIESASGGDGKIGNVRRENKLYSYEEQLAEIELKKEIAKKKGKMGSEEPKLSKKQQEAKLNQLKRESEIRAKCKMLDISLENACAMIHAIALGNSIGMVSFLPLVLRYLVMLMRSPLAAPRAVQSFLDLRKVAIKDVDKYFGDLIAHTTLRLLNPACNLDKEWAEEPIRDQTKRALNMLYCKTATKNGKPLPTFGYCFYLVKCVLKRGGESVGGDEQTLRHAIEIIGAHAAMRKVENGKEQMEVDSDSIQGDPELLPRLEMLELLTDLVSNVGGRLELLASKALVDVAECASGMEGCAEAKQEEINVLLGSLQSPSITVRETSLLSLQAMVLILPTPDVDYENALTLMRRLWIAKFDPEEDNVKLADRLWEELALDVEEELCMELVKDTIHPEEVIRGSTAAALSAALDLHKNFSPAILYQLLELYNEKLYMPPPVLDNFGRVISEAPPDEWPARSGIAMSISKVSAYLDQDQISQLFQFFVEKGLGDRNEIVRKHMLTAAVAAVDEHGKANVTSLLKVFEDFLEQAPDTASFDSVRQSVVILMGCLAKHLDKEDPKVKPIVAKLIETLSTPSQAVQEAVANCLPPLVPAIKKDAPDLVKKLLELLLESDNYGERRGAAYGLAGLVKGLGILALKQLEIMSKLQDAIQSKKSPRHREGALFAFEMLCLMLGRLFEPYVVHILPHLLLCFGDNNQYVREAADDTAKAVMSKLSAHGVKLILPSLLKALEEDSWRTKTGSVELLGAMAFCAPKQLSACLPSIVPKLMEVLNDSHLKVQKAGAQALKQIGSVIKNPEIQAIVPELLGALQDPTRKTTVCLQILLETKFVHFIDSPSLALIMPVVQRAFQDRSTETRKMSAQIIGNMYSLTDQKDLGPYLGNVIPGLKQSLLDPVPEVRNVSSKALGAMVKGMGENGFEDLLPWLMQTLTSEQSSVDRSGAAQGLSEVVGGLGTEKLSRLMPDIIATAERPDIAPHVRDGYIMMFIYLPTVFGDDFLPFLGPIIPPILQALADENEYVRDTALRAGQRIVSLYADKAIELLLPELEKGLFADNWRIRYSSVQLLGDLLYKISGVTGKMSTETASEDDNFGTETSQKAIMGALGTDRRNRVLAGLYMGRSDTALLVRQSALHVWKIIVSHTPKTLREILSTLFTLLLGCLASSSHDKRQVAARTLGDVVRKLGEKVLPEIIPILEKGLESERSDQRQGVCIGLSEIMSSTSRDHVVVFADSLIPTVRKALCDPLPEVREAAARTFDNLHTNIGQRALDDILPALLRLLDDEETSEFALDGLKQVMAVKSRVVLPYLVPQLTAAPVNTRALSFLSSVAGDALTKHLSKILPALLTSLSEKMGTPYEQEELEYCQSVVLSVVDEVGVRVIMDELLAATTKEQAGLRCAAVTILHSYCELTKADYSEYVPQLFRGLLHLFTDSDERVLHAAWDCLNAVIKKLDGSDLLANVTNMRQALRFAVSDFKEELLPGFCLLKKGIAPIWQIYREAILNGPPELKESAAIGLGEVIKRTSPEALKPSVVGITGPLIRILGDRFSFNVKVAVLETLGLLLGKCGPMLKPFLPQLQTTFVKALNDTNRAVRLRAAAALGKLIVIHTRVDPLFQELHTGVKNADDAAIRDTMLQALRGCISGAGAKLSDLSRRQMMSSLEGYLSTPEDTTRTTAAACVGAFCACLPPDDLTSLLINQLLDTDPSQDWTLRHGRAVALYIALKEAPTKIMQTELRDKVIKAIHVYTTADRIPLCLSGLRSVGFLFRYNLQNGEPLSQDLLQDLAKSLKHESNDVKQLVSQVVTYVAKSSAQPLDWAVTKSLVPVLVMGTKEKNTAVRSYSESALVALLKLRDGNDTLQTCLSKLEPGMSDSLNEVTSKALNKLAAQPDVGDEDIDDTILV